MSSAEPDASAIESWPDRRLTAASNILIIAARPGEESRDTGGLIAELCRRGRPPFVTILTDGAGRAGQDAEAVAARLGAAARRAVRHLGLPPDRLLLVGLHEAEGAAPAMIDALVSAYDLISWARDCQTICVAGDAPAAGAGLPRLLAERLSAEAGLGCVLSRDGTRPPGAPGAGRIDIGRHLAAKARAQAEYPAMTAATTPYEHFAVLHAAAEAAPFWI